MMLCLFFDVDALSKDFLLNHPVTGCQSVFFEKEFNNPETLTLEPYKNAQVISVFPHSEALKNSYLDFFPNLKLIATRSTGFNHIDLEYARKRNISVVHVPHYGEITVAEFTIGTMIGLSRKIYKAKSQMKANNVHINEYIGFDLFNRTLGVIGTGAIGQHVIKLAKAFGMKILAFDPFPHQAVMDLGVDYVSLTELYKNADIITLHCPATKENYHLLDETAFSQMKQGVCIVNTARGSLIDTESLYNALKSGKVGGAALDVLENEDIITQREISTDMNTQEHDFFIDSVINFKMMQLDTTLITPHIAFNTTDAVHRILQTTVENIQAFEKGQILHSVFHN